WAHLSSARTFEPVLRVPLYPAKSSFNFSPGCQRRPTPIIHLNFESSMMPATQASSAKSMLICVLRKCGTDFSLFRRRNSDATRSLEPLQEQPPAIDQQANPYTGT